MKYILKCMEDVLDIFEELAEEVSDAVQHLLKIFVKWIIILTVPLWVIPFLIYQAWANRG